jgi:hypothetical protein
MLLVKLPSGRIVNMDHLVSITQVAQRGRYYTRWIDSTESHPLSKADGLALYKFATNMSTDLPAWCEICQQDVGTPLKLTDGKTLVACEKCREAGNEIEWA